MIRFNAAAAAALMFAATAAHAQMQAQGSPAGPGPASASAVIDERDLVQTINRLVQDIYVVPEKRPVIVQALNRALAEGRYASEDPQVIVQRMSDDMRTASGDGHMYVTHDPAQAAALRQTGNDDEDGEYWARRAAKGNHGVAELKILDGNVRYLNLNLFMWMGDASKPALDDAMRFLRGGDAVIIDLRTNGGGSPEAVKYVTSHFVEPGKHLIDFEMRSGKTTSRAVEGELPAGRMIGKPLYVLTSRRSASAAEEFAAHVANFKLGELVGQTTAGAAHRNGLFPAGQGFVASVSEGRPIHPVTKGNWEAVGVKPTIESPVPEALNVAHHRAVERLARTEGPDQARYAFLTRSLAARVSPAALSAPVQAYAGRFGERAIAVENGALSYQRNGGAPSRLLPISGDTFAIESDPSAHLRVRMEGGRAAAIELIRDDGSNSTFARTADS